MKLRWVIQRYLGDAKEGVSEGGFVRQQARHDTIALRYQDGAESCDRTTIWG